MHTSSTLILVLAVFGASLVEMVEALTIVVAAGVSRGWRSALEGAAAAIVVLGLLVVAVGLPLIHYIPLDALRVVVGALLLVLGLSWLRKAILRASGHKDKHDEDAIYATTVAELAPTEDEPRASGRDGVAFAVAFKGVFFEGTEVVLIVVSLGATQHRLVWPPWAPAAAALLCPGGRALRGPPALRGAREHHQVRRRHHVDQLRALLGGRGGRGALARRRPLHPRADRVLHRGHAGQRGRVLRTPQSAPARGRGRGAGMTAALGKALRAFGHFWWDFLIGDTPEFAVAVGLLVGLAFALDHQRVVAAIVLPLLATAFLLASTLRGRRPRRGADRARLTPGGPFHTMRYGTLTPGQATTEGGP